MKLLVSIVTFTLLFSILVEKNHRIFSASYQYFLAETDSQVTGEIERSKPRYFSGYMGTNRVYDIEYGYFVRGEFYQNHIVAYEKKSESVDRNLARYPIGKKVAVYYDSESPQWSVLEPGGLSVYVCIQLVGNLIVAPLMTYLIARYAFHL